MMVHGFSSVQTHIPPPGSRRSSGWTELVLFCLKWCRKQTAAVNWTELWSAQRAALTDALLCSPRGQESAGMVTSNGASPPTYTTHKVKSKQGALFHRGGEAAPVPSVWTESYPTCLQDGVFISLQRDGAPLVRWPTAGFRSIHRYDMIWYMIYRLSVNDDVDVWW